jgi:hypothetical protein
MAGRPRNRHPDLYSTTEVAETTGLSPRNVIYLCERQELPIVAGGEGSGSHRLLDDEGLARAAVIAALNRTGIGVIAAAHIAEAVWAKEGKKLLRSGPLFTRSGLSHPAGVFGDGDYFLEIYDGRFITLVRKVADKDDSTLQTTIRQPLGMLDTEPDATFTEAEAKQLTDDSQGSVGMSDEAAVSPLSGIFASVRGFVENKIVHHQTCLSVNLSMVLRDTKKRIEALKAT